MDNRGEGCCVVTLNTCKQLPPTHLTGVRGAPSSRSGLYHVAYKYCRNGGLTYSIYSKRWVRVTYTKGGNVGMTVAACVSPEEHMHPLVILTRTLRHREVHGV